MTIRISTAARNAAVAAIAALVDGGSSAGKIRVYTGSQPATPATSPSGTLLLEFDLSDPAFGSPATGTVTLDVTPIPADQGITNGTAGWARILDSTEAAGTGLGIIDCACTSGELELSTTSITTGLDVEVTSLTLTMPSQ